jgi:hypothetical protein
MMTRMPLEASMTTATSRHLGTQGYQTAVNPEPCAGPRIDEVGASPEGEAPT